MENFLIKQTVIKNCPLQSTVKHLNETTAKRAFFSTFLVEFRCYLYEVAGPFLITVCLIERLLI